MSETTGNEYGVLVTGFSRMRLPEIRQDIINSLNTRIGVTFETRPDSITGQFIDTFAEREATLWELAEAVYHAMYPVSAFGISLDHAVAYSGVRRYFAQTSNAWVVLYGTEETVIPQGSVIRNSMTQDEFATRADQTISRSETADITFSIDTAVVGQSYWINVNSAIYSYTCQPFDSTINIASHLYTSLIASKLEQSIDANHIRLWTIESVPFPVLCSTNISIVKLGSLVFVDALASGALDVSANNLDQIVTTLFGWDDVNNPVAGFLGRETETDDELRLRYNTGVYQLGAATLPAIQANLSQVIPGIISLQVFENVENVPDIEGRKPHSIEVVAYGGDAQQIGEAIFFYKAAGIDTNGSIHIVVQDSSGYNHDIYFNRPTPIFFWVAVDVALYNEEIFPDQGASIIQAVIADTGNSFSIGKDVIIQRFYGPIYSSVSGIGNMTIKIAYSSNPNYIPVTGDYVTSNIPISARQLAQFDATRVSVTVL